MWPQHNFRDVQSVVISGTERLTIGVKFKVSTDPEGITLCGLETKKSSACLFENHCQFVSENSSAIHGQNYFFYKNVTV